MPDFKLPDLGEGVTEGEIDRWLVEEGDVIQEDAPLVEVITDKATAEIPSPYGGLVTRIHVPEGSIVPVGTVLVTIGEPAADRTPKSAPGGSELEIDPRRSRADRTPESAPGGAEPEPPVQEEVVSGETEGIAEPVAREIKAMPPVRRLARELGVDLSHIEGSGPDGRITRTDVESFATAVRTDRPEVEEDKVPSTREAEVPGPVEAEVPPPVPAEPPTPPAPPPLATRGGGRREPLRGVRRTIAQRMAEAHRLVPPVTHVEECDVTELDATRKLANERDPGAPKLTFLPFIVKAVTAALKLHPGLNASLDEANGEIIYYDRYDIGIAVDTPQGLTVPVLRDADSKRLREIAGEIERLAAGAREGTLSIEELRGSTFTISSPGGPYGGLVATPIVNHPEAAILGVHRAQDRPVVRAGQIVARQMMNLSVTFDHRVVDGMAAARFLLDVIRSLEHPAVLAIES